MTKKKRDKLTKILAIGISVFMILGVVLPLIITN